jgi:hypothetical protein
MKANKLTDVFRHIDMKGGDTSQCWPWTSGLNKDGRPYFTYQGKKLLAYRVTYDLFHAEPLGDRLALHQCDNEICCNPHHINPGEHQKNMDEMKERQRHGLPHHTVRAIRKLCEGDRAVKEIADLYGISETTVRDIRDRKNYQHVKDEDG